jgi:hypothetical protein
MTETTKEQKDRAYEQKQAKDRCTNATTLGSVLAAGGLGLVIPPVGFGVSVVLGLAAFAFQRGSMRLDKVVHDPPDRDFARPVRLATTRIDLELLETDRLGMSARGPLDAALKAADLISAMIRAVERAQGAEIAGSMADVERRSNEALGFARRAGIEWDRFADLSPPFIDAIRGLPPLKRDDGSRATVVLRDNLPDEVLGHLYRMGVPWSGLNIMAKSTSDDVTPLMAEAVADTAMRAREYAQLLIGPEQDVLNLEPLEQLPPRVDFTVPPALPGGRAPGVVDRESQVLDGVREGQSLDQLAQSTGLTKDLVETMLRRTRRRLTQQQRQIDTALESNLETEGE